MTHIDVNENEYEPVGDDYFMGQGFIDDGTDEFIPVKPIGDIYMLFLDDHQAEQVYQAIDAFNLSPDLVHEDEFGNSYLVVIGG